MKDILKSNTLWITRDKEGPYSSDVYLWLVAEPHRKPEKRNGVFGDKHNAICGMHYWHFKNLFGYVPRKGTCHKRESLTAVGCKIMEFKNNSKI